MRNILIACVALALTACGSATAHTEAEPSRTLEATSGLYANDPAHTSLTWKIPHLGLSEYTARVSNVSIELDFDADNVENSSVRAIIDPASFDTGYPYDDKDFNAEIASSMIMNAAEFATIEFVSTSVKRSSPTSAEITGDLTMMGVTRPVTLMARYHGSTAQHPFAGKPAIGFAARATIDRTEFGNTFLSGQGLGDNVMILIEAEFIKKSS